MISQIHGVFPMTLWWIGNLYVQNIKQISRIVYPNGWSAVLIVDMRNILEYIIEQTILHGEKTYH